jgi:hypothetical protein
VCHVYSEKVVVHYERFAVSDAGSFSSFSHPHHSVYLSALDFESFKYLTSDACFVYRSVWQLDADRQLTDALPYMLQRMLLCC